MVSIDSYLHGFLRDAPSSSRRSTPMVFDGRAAMADIDKVERTAILDTIKLKKIKWIRVAPVWG